VYIHKRYSAWVSQPYALDYNGPKLRPVNAWGSFEWLGTLPPYMFLAVHRMAWEVHDGKCEQEERDRMTLLVLSTLPWRPYEVALPSAVHSL